MLDKLKQLFSDSIIYGLFFILGRFLTFLLTPLYTNYLNVVEFADITNIFSYIAFLNIFYAIGFDSAFFRFYDKNDKTQSQKIFSTSWLSILAVSSILTIIIFLNYKFISPIICDSPNKNELLIYSILIPFFDVISYVPFLYLRITNQARQFSLIKLAIIFLTIILTYIFIVYYKMGAIGVIYAHLIASLLAFFFTIHLVIKNLKLEFNLPIFKEMAQFSIPTIPAQLSGIMLNLGDKPLVKELTDNMSLSTYNANYRLGLPMMLLVLAFDYAWKPFYLSHFKDENSPKMFARVLTYLTVICALLFLVVSFYINNLVDLPFLGGKVINPIYWSGLDIVPIILAGYYFNGMYNNFAAGINISKKTKYLSYSIMVAAGFNLVSNLIFIPIYGFRAAAWNTLFSYMISAAMIYYHSQKVYPITYEWRRIIVVILSCVGVYTLITISNLYFSQIISEYISTNLFKMLGIVIFVILIYAFKFFNVNELSFLKSFVSRKKIS